MKKIAFEWRTRIVDFSTREEAEKYFDEMCTKYNVCYSTYKIYENGNHNGLLWSLEFDYTSKKAKIGGGW